jgi:hypothetical protein
VPKSRHAPEQRIHACNINSFGHVAAKQQQILMPLLAYYSLGVQPNELIILVVIKPNDLNLWFQNYICGVAKQINYICSATK